MTLSIRAENLTISIPTFGIACKKNCPYCISKMTVPIKESPRVFIRNLGMAESFANRAGVMSMLLTSKGEIIQDPFREGSESFDLALSVLIHVGNGIPRELQTNGAFLLTDEWKDILRMLANADLNTLAISVDRAAQIPPLMDRVVEVKREFPELLIRLTFNMSDMLGEQYLKTTMLRALAEVAMVDQVTFRVLSVPSRLSPETDGISQWIQGHAMTSQQVANDMIWLRRETPVRIMPDGATIYDINGLSICYSEYCIQEASQGYDTRSLIYQANGHLYTSWNSKATILF